MNRVAHKFLLAIGLQVLSVHSVLACYESDALFPSPVMGNSGEVLKLSDGTFWMVGPAYEYLYAYYPEILICPDQGFMIIDNTRIPVSEIEGPVIESSITSNFSGLEYGNIYRLANGQIWEQTQHWTWVWTWVNPQVIIYPHSGGFKMLVENIEEPVYVERIR